MEVIVIVAYTEHPRFISRFTSRVQRRHHKKGQRTEVGYPFSFQTRGGNASTLW